MKPLCLIVLLFVLSACAAQKELPIKYGTFVDERDGHVYKTVKIGEQVWMAENLAYAVRDNQSLVRCDSYSHDEANGKLYGMLYSFNALANAAPKGWHVPSEQEWQIMEHNCQDPVNRLNILYGGECRANKFNYLGTKATFYTTSHEGTPVVTRYVNKGNSTISTNRQGIAWMLSVRCVKDAM
jgi:hypothetical protein